MDADRVFAELTEDPRLPSPHGVALEVLRLAEQEDSTSTDFARVFQTDPALSALLLKLVNSPLTGLRRSIASIEQAVTILGVQAVKGIALGFSLLNDNRNGECDLFDYDRFWSESLGRAVATSHIAAYTRAWAGDEAYTYGLLGHIGRLGLAAVYPERYSDVIHTVGALDDEGLEDAEQAVFGIGAAELSGRMLESWGLPALRLAIGCDVSGPTGGPTTRHEKLAYALRCGSRIAQLLVDAAPPSAVLPTLTREAHNLQIVPEELPSVFSVISETWQIAGSILSVATRNVPELGEIYARTD